MGVEQVNERGHGWRVKWGVGCQIPWKTHARVLRGGGVVMSETVVCLLSASSAPDVWRDVLLCNYSLRGRMLAYATEVWEVKVEWTPSAEGGRNLLGRRSEKNHSALRMLFTVLSPPARPDLQSRYIIQFCTITFVP